MHLKGGNKQKRAPKKQSDKNYLNFFICFLVEIAKQSQSKIKFKAKLFTLIVAFYAIS